MLMDIPRGKDYTVGRPLHETDFWTPKGGRAGERGVGWGGASGWCCWTRAKCRISLATMSDMSNLFLAGAVRGTKMIVW